VIVDSSTLLAIIKQEPEASAMAELLQSTVSRISAANYFESAIVIDARRNYDLSIEFDRLIEDAKLVIEPVTPEQARIARQAYRYYGRGSGHPANLNFGDCFAYALARDKGEPLLYKGDDFVHTDIRSALL
jgi:ribonuclease VapC